MSSKKEKEYPVVFDYRKFNFSKLNTEPNNFSSESPIISTILLNEEITDEYIIDYLTDKIAVNEIYIPK